MTLSTFSKKYKIEIRAKRKMSWTCETWFVLFDKTTNEYVMEYNEQTKKKAMKRFSSAENIFRYVEQLNKKEG